MVRIHDVPETQSFATRRLRDGSTLKYALNVIQQPKRARACGMGAKAHADRRPVDPPPCVELKVYKIDANGETDITFAYNANFFLFATLAPARPIAQGRGMPSPQNPAPVLTGVTVSGLAYLERPELAGYFVFPDLSIRHEGNYRLHFQLFEEPKAEPEYEDIVDSEDPHAPNAYFYHRAEVKSEAFTVYSAKKFPGLAESTALSRVIAEQGCRVRIRRDVRMRRRDNRGGRDREERDETAALRANRQCTPDYAGTPQPERKRSDSNASCPPNDMNAHGYNDRNNGYYGQGNHPPQLYREQNAQAVPPPPQGYPHNMVQQPAQKPMHQNNPFVAQQPVHQEMHQMRRASGEYYPRRESEGKPQMHQQQQQQYRPATPVHQHYQQQPPMAHHAAPQQMYQQQPHHYQQQQPQQHHYGYQQHQQQPQQYAAPYGQDGRVTLPPLEPKWNNNSPSAALPSPSYGAPLHQAIQQNIKVPHPNMHHAASPHIKSYSPMAQQNQNEGNGKRQWSNVFNDDNIKGRLTDGARPVDNYGEEAEDEDSDSDFSSNMLFYKRADGERVSRVFCK